MAEYLRPGVYVEEFDSGPNSIESASTSTASFIGPTERGPINPQLVTNFFQFKRVFGAYLDDAYLTYAAEGFFTNGGKRCWISRIVSAEHWQEWFSRNKGRALIFDRNFNFISIRSNAPGNWYENLTIKVSQATNTADNPDYFKLTIYYNEDENIDTLGQEREIFDDLSSDPQSDRYYQKVVNGSSNFIALYPIDPPVALVLPVDLNNAAQGTALNTFKETVGPGAADLAGDDDQSENRWQRLTIPAGAPAGNTQGEVTINLAGGGDAFTLRTHDNMGAGSVWIELTPTTGTNFNIRVKKFDTEIIDLWDAKYTPTITRETYTDLTNDNTGVDSVEDRLHETTGSEVGIIEMVGGTQNDGSVLDVIGDTITYLELIGSDRGYLITLSPNNTALDYTISPADYDGVIGEVTDNDGEAIETITTGLRGLETVKDISIVCSTEQDTNNEIPKKIIAHCERLRDRFAIYQPDESDTTVNQIQNVRKFGDHKYAAIYAPWIKVLNPLTDRLKLIPPAGHVAGVYARTDINRGVHKAPANESLLGVSGLQTPISDGLQESLNPLNVNLVRNFEGRGTLVWGARTNSSNPKWKYINVRRLFIAISKSIEKSTRWAVFEPNNRKLWSSIRTTVNQYLFGIWRTGALMGANPDDAYFVECDRRTMTEDDIQNGRLVCIIGLATTRPAEFVIFRLTQTKEGATFEDINQ